MNIKYVVWGWSTSCTICLLTNVALNAPLSGDPRSAQLAAALATDLTKIRQKMKDQRTKLQDALDADQAGWCTFQALISQDVPRSLWNDVSRCLKMPSCTQMKMINFHYFDINGTQPWHHDCSAMILWYLFSQWMLYQTPVFMTFIPTGLKSSCVHSMVVPMVYCDTCVLFFIIISPLMPGFIFYGHVPCTVCFSRWNIKLETDIE